ERGTDPLVGALDFQRAGNDATNDAQLTPLLSERVVAPAGGHGWKRLKVHRLCRWIARQPRLLRREAEHRREPANSGAKQMVQHRETRFALRRRIGIAIKRVLADIEIERREIDRHKRIERGKDA